MNVRIHKDDHSQEDDAGNIKFMKKWKISSCSQKPDHKSHEKANTEHLENKIQVCFIEKINFRRTIIIVLFGKKHEPKKKSISSIIEEFPVTSL